MIATVDKGNLHVYFAQFLYKLNASEAAADNNDVMI